MFVESHLTIRQTYGRRKCPCTQTNKQVLNNPKDVSGTHSFNEITASIEHFKLLCCIQSDCNNAQKYRDEFRELSVRLVTFSILFYSQNLYLKRKN